MACLTAVHPTAVALPHGHSYSLLQFDTIGNAQRCVQQLDEAWLPEVWLACQLYSPNDPTLSLQAAVCLALGLANLLNPELNFLLAHHDLWQPVTTTTQEMVLPDGLRLLPNFVSETEAQALLTELEQDPALFQPLRTRTVAQWGYAFDYDTFGAVALPHPVTPLTEHLMAQLPFLEHAQPSSKPASKPSTEPSSLSLGPYTPPNQCTLNRYRPGDGIPAHADDPAVFGQAIWILSLGQPLSMEFAPLVSEAPKVTVNRETSTKTATNLAAATEATEETVPSADLETAFGVVNLGKSTQGRVRDPLRSISVWLPSRSLLVMTGPARYDWTHGIAQRKTDLVDGEVRARGTRTSLTFRHVRSQTRDSPSDVQP